MTLLTVTDIHKSHRGRHLLRGVSLVIQDGERLGLLGPNGSGKSTLLRIIAGTEDPDSGQRVLRRDLRLGYLEQEPKLPAGARVRDVVRAGLPGREEILAELAAVHARCETAAAHAAAQDPGTAERTLRALLVRQSALEDELQLVGGHDVEHRVEELLAHLGLPDAEADCGTLSGGEARRVALARLLLGEPELLLLDEPTNHLDAEVIAWLEQHLLARRTPLLMVTHDRYVLDRVADRILELDRGQLVSYTGGYGDYLLARAEADAREEHAEGSRQNLLRRETAWMRRGPPARTTKAKARIDRYAALVSSRTEARGDNLAFRIPQGPRLGDRVLRL
ncbi:MAG TPA: ATP-binding cassette domain-containing protein, partial [Planctomycetota bacterium]|nr:ATP-binding cassette domain-containing protein [Planctomycetota bacterium]